MSEGEKSKIDDKIIEDLNRANEKAEKLADDLLFTRERIRFLSMKALQEAGLSPRKFYVASKDGQYFFDPVSNLPNGD